MSVNGVTGNTRVDAYSTYQTASVETKPEEVKTPAKDTEKDGVVYEPSKETKKTYKTDPALIAKLQADAEARTAQFRNLVEQMMSKQGSTIGQADDIWKFLASGNFTVDAATKSQAQADIAEDGYWGVEQTSDRIIDFAKALTGGDPDKIEEMRSAFEKGFKQATGSWGKELPDISQQTYKAVMDKFDAWAKESQPVEDPTATQA